MTATDRALQAANSPITKAPTVGLISTVGTTATLLFTDLAAPGVVRIVRVTNTHASQSLALILLPLGQAPAAEAVTTHGYYIAPGATFTLPIAASLRIAIVGSGAATTFAASTSDV